MIAEHQAILAAYEDGLLPSQIAALRELDETSVKACLAQYSEKYRVACGTEEYQKAGEDFNKDDNEWALRALKETGMSTDDEYLRTKIAMYVRDDFKGRREPARMMQGNNFNILMLNEKLQGLKSVAERIKGAVQGSSVKELVNV